MKTDISNRSDLEKLINRFYEKAKMDPVIGHFFGPDSGINWDKHLPIMVTFWENTLFFTGGYSGDMMGVHRNVHHKNPMKPEHLERWTQLFCLTVGENFEGESAERARQRALGMATMLQIKIPVN